MSVAARRESGSSGGVRNSVSGPAPKWGTAPTRVFLCVLACHLLVAIEKVLLDQGMDTSWASVRDALAWHHIVTIVLPTDSGATMLIRKASTPESEHRYLYWLLGVDENIMSPKRIRSETSTRE